MDTHSRPTVQPGLFRFISPLHLRSCATLQRPPRIAWPDMFRIEAAGTSIEGTATHDQDSSTISLRLPKETPQELRFTKGHHAVINYLGKQLRIRPIRSTFNFIDLFAGIGGMRLGFEPFGGKCVFSSEWDEKAQDSYEANFGDRPHGDITQVTPSDIPDHDVLLAGFPCQPFSIIGKRRGFSDTRGTLFYSIASILDAKQPAAILLENVKQFRSHDNGRTCDTVLGILHDLGYHTQLKVLNALDFGVPQKRERVFIVGFRNANGFQFPSPLPFRADLGDVLDPKAEEDPSLAGTPYIQEKRRDRARAQGAKIFSPSVWHENKGGHLGIHPYSCALRHNASHNYLMVNGERRLSSRECLRLQGFPDSFKIVVSHRDIRAQAGNAVAVPVIASLALEMLSVMTADPTARNSHAPELPLFEMRR